MPIIVPAGSGAPISTRLNSVLDANGSATRLHGVNAIRWRWDFSGGTFALEDQVTAQDRFIVDANIILSGATGIGAAPGGSITLSGGGADTGVGGVARLRGGGATGAGGIGGNADLQPGAGLAGNGNARAVDANGNEIAIFSGVAAAVNEVTVINAAAGLGPIISATGGDADIDVRYRLKGDGTVTSHRFEDSTGVLILSVSADDPGAGNSISIRKGLTESRIIASVGDLILQGPATGLIRLVGFATTPTTVKVANYTVINSDTLVPADTSGGGFTITLPVTPKNGHIVNIKKVSTDANTLTIARNGNTIDGVAADLTTASVNKPNFQLQFQTANTDWRIL